MKDRPANTRWLRGESREKPSVLTTLNGQTDFGRLRSDPWSCVAQPGCGHNPGARRSVPAADLRQHHLHATRSMDVEHRAQATGRCAGLSAGVDPEDDPAEQL